MACLVYPADISSGKVQIEKILQELVRTDSSISAKKAELADLRADREKAKKDSVNQQKAFVEKEGKKNRESAHLDSLCKKNDQGQVKIKQAQEKAAQDSLQAEKKIGGELLRVAKEKASLDSLVDAMNKENDRLVLERENTVKDSSNTEKSAAYALSGLKADLANLDSMINFRTMIYDTFALRHQKLELDHQIEEKQKTLNELMALNLEKRMEGDGPFQATQKELGELLEQRKKLLENQDIAKWEKAEAKMPLTKRLARLDSLILQTDNLLTELTARRGKKTQDSIEIYNGFGKTFQQTHKKLKLLDSLILTTRGILEAGAIRYGTIRNDSAAVVKQFQKDMEKIKKETARQDSLLLVKNRELEKLKEQQAKLRQDSTAILSQNLQAAELGRQNAEKIDRLIQEKERELNQIDSAKKGFQALMANEIAKIDSLIMESQKTVISFMHKREKQKLYATEARKSNSDKEKRAFKEVAGKDSVVQGLENELKTLSKALDKTGQDTLEIRKKQESEVAVSIKEIALCDSLISVKEKELAALVEKRAKARQDSVAALKTAKEKLVSVRTVIAQQQTALGKIRKQVAADSAAAGRVKHEYASLVKEHARADSAANRDVGKLDSIVNAAKAGTAAADKEVEALLKGTGFGRTKMPDAEKKKIVSAIENCYSLLQGGRSAEAKAVFVKEGDLLKKYMLAADFSELKSIVEAGIKAPKKEEKETIKPASEPEPAAPVKPEMPKQEPAKAKEEPPEVKKPQVTDKVKPADRPEPVPDKPVDTVAAPVSPAEKPPDIDRRDATIFISSIPPKAKVHMDGKYIGETNVADLRVSSGTHQMTFTVNNQRCTKTMTFQPGKNQSTLIRIPCQ